MKTLSKQLKEYLANRTPKQKVEDKELLDKWKNVGPTIKEYFNIIKQH